MKKIVNMAEKGIFGTTSGPKSFGPSNNVSDVFVDKIIQFLKYTQCGDTNYKDYQLTITIKYKAFIQFLPNTRAMNDSNRQTRGIYLQQFLSKVVLPCSKRC